MPFQYQGICGFDICTPLGYKVLLPQPQFIRVLISLSKKFLLLSPQSFLKQYDFIPAQARSGEPVDLKPGLEAFQSSAGLPVTGELDDETLAEMRAPLCGVEDGPQTRFHTYNRWSKDHLSYYIRFSRDRHLTYERQEEIFRKAFDAWSAAAPKLTFNRTYCLKEADIKIR